MWLTRNSVKITRKSGEPETVAMLISDTHEFIFLRMRKVASTSMRGILRPLCLSIPEDRFAHIKSRLRLEWDYHRYVFRAHDNILAAKSRMPADKFERYFKFAFIRNPWERLVSEYEFLLSRNKHGRHKRVKELDNFSEFIQMQIPRRDAYQLNMLCDHKGRVLMDFLGKLENLEQDWHRVCGQLGIEYQALPRKNVIERKPYQAYDDMDSIQVVAKHWGREIELFEYSYEDNT